MKKRWDVPTCWLPFVRRLMAHCDFVNRSLLILSQYCDLGLEIAKKLPIQAVKTDYSLKSARSFFQITAIYSQKVT